MFETVLDTKFESVHSFETVPRAKSDLIVDVVKNRKTGGFGVCRSWQPKGCLAESECVGEGV